MGKHANKQNLEPIYDERHRSRKADLKQLQIFRFIQSTQPMKVMMYARNGKERNRSVAGHFRGALDGRGCLLITGVAAPLGRTGPAPGATGKFITPSAVMSPSHSLPADPTQPVGVGRELFPDRQVVGSSELFG